MNEDSQTMRLHQLTVAHERFSSLRQRLNTDGPKGTEDKRRGLTFLAALVFCEQSCELARHAITDRMYLQELILARPIAEVSIRLLFATTVANGWNRYFKYFAQENLRYVRAMLKEKPNHADSLEYLKTAEAEVAQYSEDAMNWHTKTAMDAICKAEDAELKAKGWDAPEVTGFELDVMLFQNGHMVIHGNPDFLISNLLARHGKGKFPNRDAMVFVYSAIQMTKAVYRFRNWPNLEDDAYSLIPLGRGGPKLKDSGNPN